MPGANGTAPPHSLEAERAVIGAVFRKAAMPAAVLDAGVRPSAFWLPRHQRIFTAMLALHERGAGISQTTVAAALDEAGQLEEAGGRAALAVLDDIVPELHLLAEHARIVMRYARERSNLQAGWQIINAAGADEATRAAVESIGQTKPTASPLRFLTPAELRATAPAEPDWLLEGFIACGALTVGPAGKPKVGKSTLALALVRAIRSDAGSFLGRRIRSTQVVYLSEESASTLLHKLPAEDPGLHLLTRENAWPRPPWADVVAAATEHALKVGAELLVADTWGFWSELPADREKDAGAVQNAVAPLLQATAQGLAVMLPTHTRKAGGEDGDAIRGSNALAGAGNIVLELERPAGENAPPRQRVLVALSRFPQTPPVLLIDHDPATDSWGVIGEGQDRRDTRAASDRAALLRLLPTDEPGLTRSELETEMAAPHKQWAGTLHTLIEEGVAQQDGAGRKGDPYRWRLLRTDSAQPPAQHPRSTPELSGALPVGKHQKTKSILRSIPDCAENDDWLEDLASRNPDLSGWPA